MIINTKIIKSLAHAIAVGIQLAVFSVSTRIQEDVGNAKKWGRRGGQRQEGDQLLWWEACLATFSIW